MAVPGRLLTFPDPVDDISARLVASGVIVLAIATIVLDQGWLTIVLAYGFLARVLAGPRFSPLALLVTRLIRPALAIQPRPVPGPPKRFAQAIGAVFTVTAVVLTYGVDQFVLAKGLLALLVVAAALEALAGFCVGCRLFRLLMRVGVVPASVCESCANLWGPAPH